MPILYFIPIIHSVEDYGSLGQAIRKTFVKRGGEAAFERIQKDIREYWGIVNQKIEDALPDVRGFFIYHDGFPVGSREKILALFECMCSDHPKSPDFRLVRKLIDRGALLEGMEDMNLVVEQVQLYRHAEEASSPAEQRNVLASHAARSKEITRLRDEFIAKKINDTLPEGGKGILFIGREHDVIGELEKMSRKFTVIYF